MCLFNVFLRCMLHQFLLFCCNLISLLNQISSKLPCLLQRDFGPPENAGVVGIFGKSNRDGSDNLI